MCLYEKGERVMAGRYIGKSCPRITVSGINVPGKWQSAISVARGRCNLHVENCNKKQMTLNSAN